LSIRGFNETDWDAEIALLHRLYNQSFEGLWGFVPMSPQEFRSQAESFRPFFKPSLIAIAEDGSGPVGFAVVLPDINEVLHRIRGRLFPTGWITLFRGVRSIRTARFLILGVVPGHRGKGVAPLMSAHIASAARDIGIESAELSLVQATNKKMIHVVQSMGCPRTRRFRLMGKEL
jgi:GNAT superfamily N-acetyltransferase